MAGSEEISGPCFYFCPALSYNEFMLYQLKKMVPQGLKNIYHLGQAMLANFLNGWPAKSLKVIGVTGTNGKTTTVQMISRILEAAGHKVAMVSTINFKINEKEWVNTTKFTTLSPFTIQKFILDAVKARCEYLVLETSSHSLDQYRVWGVGYQTAVITNVTREHLDYHQTMEKYRRAKLKLFRRAERAVVNLDMEKPEEFLQFKNKKQLTYSLKNDQADIFAKNIEADINGSRFIIKDSRFKLNLLGEFNIENALAAVGAGLAENISLETCAWALEKIKSVPGRLEYVSNDKGLNIIVDYAVTPDSLEKLYALIKGLNKGKNKIIAVFGACGERDRGKRPLMGKVVSQCADYVLVTNEDPYHEDPQRIIDEVANGVVAKKEGENFWKISDRRAAIKKALQLAGPGDFVVVTGKGAEETMAVGKQRIPWNDKKVIQEVLQEAV